MVARSAQFSGAVHPAVNRFPEMTPEEFTELMADISKHGLLEPIALLPDGSLIDGRHRLQACTELGIEPRFATVNPENPGAYAYSKNKCRRQMTSGQCAILAAAALGEAQVEAKERQREGGRTAGRGRPKDPEQVPEPIDAGDARDKVAEQFDTNPKYVDYAQRLRKRSPDLAQAVLEGMMSLQEALKEDRKRHPSQRKAPKIPSLDTKRGRAVHAKAFQRAADFASRIDGVVGYCDKVNVDVIRSDERLRRHWEEACKTAIKALKAVLQRLDNEGD